MDDLISCLTVLFNIVIFLKPFFTISVDNFYNLAPPKFLMISSLVSGALYLFISNPKLIVFTTILVSIAITCVLLNDIAADSIGLSIICLISIVFRFLDGFFVVGGLGSLSYIKKLYCMLLTILFVSVVDKVQPFYFSAGYQKFCIMIYALFFYYSLKGCYLIIEKNLRCPYFGGLTVFITHFFCSVSLFYSQSAIFTDVDFQFINVNLEGVYIWSYFVALVLAAGLKLSSRHL